MYCPYSGLDAEIEKNISDFKKAIKDRGGLGSTRLVVCQANGQRSSRLYEIQFIDGECYDNPINLQFDTYIKSDNQPANVEILQKLLRTVKSVAPADSYAMIIGSHGSAWLPAGVEIEALRYGAPMKKSFGTATTPNQIANTTLTTALQNENMHLNYLMFDACYMSTIETAYDFHNICDYYLATPNEILSQGIPYHRIGDALIRHDYRSVVDIIYDFYNNSSAPYVSFSMIDCQDNNMENLAATIQEINRTCLSTTADIDEVQIMDGLYKPLTYDLQDYMDHFCTDATLLNKFSRQLKTLVPYAKSTAEVFTYFNSTRRITVNHFCGISTSQPTINSAATKLRDTAWWAVTH